MLLIGILYISISIGRYIDKYLIKVVALSRVLPQGFK